MLDPNQGAEFQGDGFDGDIQPQDDGGMGYIQDVTQQINIADQIEEQTLTDMKQQLFEDYETDKASMSGWFTKMKKGIELAQMLKHDKTYPHDKAANVKYPLVTSAALHFNARTYPAIVPSGNPVLAKINGEDPEGIKAARGDRVTDYTSHQLRNEMANWEEDMDRLTFIGPIVGTMFKKVWFDPAINEIKCKLCTPGKVIVNHNISHLSEAPAITHEIEKQQHEVETLMRVGVWSDAREEMHLPEDEKSKPVEFLEQHLRFDLDDDGYAEPYIVTVHKDSRAVVRVVANFTLDDVMMNEGQILTVKPSTYFVPYTFLPAFDGGFFGDRQGVYLHRALPPLRRVRVLHRWSINDASHSAGSLPFSHELGLQLRLVWHYFSDGIPKSLHIFLTKVSAISE